MKILPFAAGLLLLALSGPSPQAVVAIEPDRARPSAIDAALARAVAIVAKGGPCAAPDAGVVTRLRAPAGR